MCAHVHVCRELKASSAAAASMLAEERRQRKEEAATAALQAERMQQQAREALEQTHKLMQEVAVKDEQVHTRGVGARVQVAQD